MSGVYYAAVPSGSAPLVLRRPRTDESRGDEPQPEATMNDNSDAVLAPTEGDLILFPPWVEHGVPLAEAQENKNNSYNNLPRVSFAFNVTGAFAFGDDPWNVTRTE